MTDLLKQMAEALRALMVDIELSPRFGGDNWTSMRNARAALALFDAQAAEQAAGGGEAVPWYEDRNGALRGSPDKCHGSKPAAIWLDSVRYTHPAPAAPVQQVGELPPLPIEWRKVEDADGIEVPVFRAFQMWDYARAALSTRPEVSDAEIDSLRRDAERLDYLISQTDDGPTLVVWKQDYKNEPFTTLRACGSINVTGHFESVRAAIDAALAARGEKR